jgi:hypothetical protein
LAQRTRLLLQFTQIQKNSCEAIKMEHGPIVIGPLEIKHSSLTYTCRGDGLRVFGNAFDINVASNLPLLTPKLTKKGTVAVHQPRISQQHSDYWKAQCVFRGLPHAGRTVKALQDILRDPTKRAMNAELAEIEKRLNKEFFAKNAAAREEQWKTLDTAKKAERDPTRLLKETFPPGGPETEAIVVKTYLREALHVAAGNLGLRTKSANAPKTTESPFGPDRWIVVGRKSADVAAKVQEIAREAQRAIQRWEEEQEAEVNEAHEKVISQLRRGAAWDVTGSWRIKCREIEYSYSPEDMSLDIHLSKANGRLQMYGQFDFGILEGILRFEKQGAAATGTSDSKSKAPKSRESPFDEYEEEEEDEEDEGESANFYLGAKDKPSPQQPTWNFRWRGRETGEGEIQLGSDEKLCSITFSGPGGCKLTGTFNNEYTGKSKFSGIKTSTEQRKRSRGIGVEEQWRGYNARAYERARVGRWG